MQVIIKLPMRFFKRRIGFRFTVGALFMTLDNLGIDHSEIPSLEVNNYLEEIIKGAAQFYKFKYNKRYSVDKHYDNWMNYIKKQHIDFKSGKYDYSYLEQLGNAFEESRNMKFSDGVETGEKKK